jgi:phytoene synthase
VALDDAYRHCEALVRDADKDRFIAGLFAPAARRRHLYALYAFAAEIARVREAAREPMPGELRLQWWRDAVAGGGEAHPVAAALRDTMARCALTEEALIALIDAHTFDLYDDAMAGMADLEAYAQATAGTAFALAARCLADDPRDIGATAPAALACGLTEVVRRFPYHRGHGQLYVPADLLAQHGVTRDGIAADEPTDGLRAALTALRARARAAYDAFRAALPATPEAVAPAFLTAALVPLWLRRLDRADPLTPVEVPQWRRQWRMWRASRRWPAL